MKKTIYLFVDGSNLYGGQYDLFGPGRYLSFPKFIDEAEDHLKIKFDRIFFYASFSPGGKMPDKKSKYYLKNEALFYKDVKKVGKLVFFKGYRSKTSGKEKEVDAKLAVDIVDFAHLDKYDELFLFSGDADFMHALKIAQDRKKKISILALENRVPNRFAFFYTTHVFVFDNKPKGFFSEKQKIKRIILDKNGVIKEIK